MIREFYEKRVVAVPVVMRGAEAWGMGVRERNKPGVMGVIRLRNRRRVTRMDKVKQNKRDLMIVK